MLFLSSKKLFLKEGFVFFSFFMYTLSMAAKRASKSSSVVEHFTCSNGFTPASKLIKFLATPDITVTYYCSVLLLRRLPLDLGL